MKVQYQIRFGLSDHGPAKAGHYELGFFLTNGFKRPVNLS